jgi:uncharacterized phage infection (PIP) family protein YhgE
MLKLFYYTGLILSCTGLIIYKLNTMNENLNQIKADLQAANDKADKIQADVTLLHTKIDAIPGDVPTAEEWAEVKQLSSDLNSKLQNIDDATPEETV